MIDFDVICNDRAYYGNGPHVHADDMLFVPLDGVFSVATDDRPTVIGHGAVWFVPGRCVHQVDATIRQRHLCYYADLESLDGEGFAQPRCWSMSTVLLDLMRLRRHFLPGRDAAIELSRESLDRMIVHEVGRIASRHPAPQRADEIETLLLSVKQFIAAHLDEDLRSGPLAERFQLSERTLARWFSAREETSIGQYVLEARLLEAARLLHSSSLPVADIQAAVGFSSAAHFAYAVRRRFGMAPSRLRQGLPDMAENR